MSRLTKTYNLIKYTKLVSLSNILTFISHLKLQYEIEHSVNP